MTNDEYRDTVLLRLGKLEASVTALSQRLANVETKSAVDEVHRTNVEARLGKIESGLNRLLWIIIGAFVTAIVVFVVSGGLVIATPA
jgi:hypothetical protein